MHEPCLSPRTGAATADIDHHPVDEVIELRQIREINIEEDHDAFSRHLPPELISHIFTIYTETFNSSFDIVRPSTERGPLLLGAVSKLWREVAFGTPQLWNTINIHIRLPSNNITAKIELTKHWLDRSGQLPLYLSLRIGTTDIELESRLLGPLFSLIRNLSPRWYLLVLDISPILYTTFIDDLTCAPRLHTLKLVDQMVQKGQFFLAQTPSLKYLEISLHYLSEIAIEWGNITRFQADCLGIDEFFETLRRAGRLTYCRLRGINADLQLYQIPTTPLTHSALKQLHLVPSEVYGWQMDDLFDLLVFPSLENFGYECTGLCRFPLNSLISLFDRSQCQLTHFDLSGDLSEVNANDLIPLISALPTLTHFKLDERIHRSDEDEGIMTDKLLQKLTPIEGIRAGLLPCLQSLKFHGDQKFSWNCLAAFIIARLTEDNNGSNNSIADNMHVARNSPVFRRNKNSIRLVCLVVKVFEPLLDLDSFARLNLARNAGVSIEIKDECGTIARPRLPSHSP